MKYSKIREEELKNKIGQDFFKDFDTTEIVGNIDFTVKPKSNTPSQKALFDEVSLLWAEAKTGDYDLFAMFAQLIITIGKARTFDQHLPPSFLGVFDFKKIVFIPYGQIVDIFLMNDFNWNVTPSNHETKEFLLIKARIESILQKETFLFDYLDDEKELQFFIKNNLGKAISSARIHIDKNNFVSIYLRWLVQIKPHISFDWEAGKKLNILDSDFFLADLFVDDKNTTTIEDDTTIKDDLFVVFKSGRYEITKENIKQLYDASIAIKDKIQYEQFWKKYKRPPISEFHDYIMDRRDLLIFQDIRERKGAFFTPQIWIELSQKYLADVLGKDWQEDYYIWDCAAGTGNLLAGLTNKYNIYASTLDQADVNVMQERIKNGAILLNNNIFQFDFLNDDFIPVSKGGKMPDSLYKIINDPEKRKKLVVYINPPYAEHGNSQSRSGRLAKSGVANQSKVYNEFSKIVGTATRELFSQFFLRVYKDLYGSKLASFSTLKHINSQNFIKFRDYFDMSYKKGFVVPANTFDNVKGFFPVSFLIWDSNKKEKIEKISVDVINETGVLIHLKGIYAFGKNDFISSWLRKYYDINSNEIGFLILPGVDMQAQNGVYFTTEPTKSDIIQHKNTKITPKNLVISSIYLSVRHCIKATWINDRDQYLYPNDGWQKDKEFQNDCLAFALFHSQNKISTRNEKINHWIPFTEHEVNAQAKFESHFMTDFIKSPPTPKGGATANNLFGTTTVFKSVVAPPLGAGGLIFSQEATSVFDAGRELWKYYHSKKEVNVNASLYDIRDFFQGRNEKGKMNNKSQDTQYMVLINSLRDSLKALARKIEPKVYEYGFLKE